MSAEQPRARDLGIPLSGTPGRLNAITDVPGLEVGYTTLWAGSGPLLLGEGPIRTGVTAILPRGRADPRPCFGGSFALNAAGELTGCSWLEERGLCEGPILITNTHSVGVVRDAAIQWMRRQQWPFEWTIPIVGETYDGLFNDINGCHVKSLHAFDAINGASGGTIAEGNVGGGTGMITYEYKGGTGTSSRRLSTRDGAYTVGVLVQSNYGERRHLRIGGLRMGDRFTDDLPRFLEPSLISEDIRTLRPTWCKSGDGSIIVIVATDAPLLPHQLNRIAKRPALALGRLGAVGGATSGDIFLALSTVDPGLEARGSVCAPTTVNMHPNLGMTPLFEATIDATEEAILNALVSGESAEGANRLHVSRLPHARVQEQLRAHHLLEPIS